MKKQPSHFCCVNVQRQNTPSKGARAGLSTTLAFASEGFWLEIIQPKTLWQRIFEKMRCHGFDP
ncbi:MAG: hypothetical protein JXR70_04715 [Spirochaetales bacterium]|nr:hypothetical protein [Spirochaetales bacterium]